MSVEPSEADLGQKAVDLGFITARQLGSVLEDLSGKQGPLTNPPTTLKAALLTRGLLTEDQVRRLTRPVLTSGSTLRMRTSTSCSGLTMSATRRTRLGESSVI